MTTQAANQSEAAEAAMSRNEISERLEFLGLTKEDADILSNLQSKGSGRKVLRCLWLSDQPECCGMSVMWSIPGWCRFGSPSASSTARSSSTSSATRRSTCGSAVCLSSSHSSITGRNPPDDARGRRGLLCFLWLGHKKVNRSLPVLRCSTTAVRHAHLPRSNFR